MELSEDIEDRENFFPIISEEEKLQNNIVAL